MAYQIALDGPAGAGKSTIAKLVAKELGFIYVDTGAMYRAIALHVKQSGTDPEDEAAVAEAVKDVQVELQAGENGQIVILNGEDVSGMIRTQEIGEMASRTSRYGCVRSGLTDLQREMAQRQSVIMDGRDIGTTVLPDADLKVYLTASVEERARRRFEQLRETGADGLDIKEIEEEIRTRDEQDMNREISPLRQAEDAVLLDSSDMTIDEVTQEIIRLFRERTGA